MVKYGGGQHGALLCCLPPLLDAEKIPGFDWRAVPARWGYNSVQMGLLVRCMHVGTNTPFPVESTIGRKADRPARPMRHRIDIEI